MTKKTFIAKMKFGNALLRCDRSVEFWKFCDWIEPDCNINYDSPMCSGYGVHSISDYCRKIVNAGDLLIIRRENPSNPESPCFLDVINLDEQRTLGHRYLEDRFNIIDWFDVLAEGTDFAPFETLL